MIFRESLPFRADPAPAGIQGRGRDFSTVPTRSAAGPLRLLRPQLNGGLVKGAAAPGRIDPATDCPDPLFPHGFIVAGVKISRDKQRILL